MFQTNLSMCYFLMIRTSYIRAKNNKELHLIYAWLNTNKLSIHLSKNNFMVISETKRPRIPRIHINNHQITDYDSSNVIINTVF